MLVDGIPDHKCGRYGYLNKRHKPCGQPVVTGTWSCPHHAGKPLAQAKAEGAIRVEAVNLYGGDAKLWTLDGHDGAEIDPRVEILRMIAFWRWKANLYGSLLQRAYAAAERLAKEHRVHEIVTLDAPDAEYSEDGVLHEHPALQAARHDLQSVFAQGGITVLIGHKYDVDRNGRVFPVDEGIRGLVELETKAHTQLQKCIALAVSAKVAEARVQLAEQVGVMIQAVILGVLRDLGVQSDNRVMEIIAANIDSVAGTASLAAA